MSPPGSPPAGRDRGEAASPATFRDLSRTFWRGTSSTHGLAPAIAEVLDAFNSHIGARRTSVWLHDRRARQLALIASTDHSWRARAPRVAVSDASAAAARGLRLLEPEIVRDGSAAIIIAPLRGWRRALGTLVIEPPFARDLDEREQIELANELARQLAVGIENVLLLEDMLRQRRLLEDTFNSLADLVIVTDRSHRVVQMNDAFAMRIGKSRPELLDQQLADLVGTELAEWAVEAEATAERGEDAPRARTIEHAQLGGVLNVTATPLINEDGEPVGTVLVARDITRQTALEAEKEALRAQLAQSEKLASLGQFVAGIAHEINNPLQGVLGHIELLLWTKAPRSAAAKKPETMREVRKALRRIHHEADRAAKIVRDLLTFSGGSHRVTRRRLRVDRVLARALGSQRSSLHRAGIEIVRELDPDVPSILGDQLLLHQAFVNVIANAAHAIESTGQPGTITFSTSAPEPTTVRIKIRDTGPGIPADVLPRVFDPFFTTKDVGKGTGLGLTLAYGVIHEHGGTIHASNAPAGGAIFTIDLPAAEGLKPSPSA
ncbi:MAG TPA: ATP-binding protein [Vicinamibacterales bacterium]|nr:ATP-binding protein [Vicinamibacterales bacterium]